MAFEPLTDSLHKLTDRLEDFVTSSVDFYKLRLFKSATKAAISLVNLLVYGSLFLFVLVFLSIGGALWLGTFFEHMFIGFLLIGAFYAVILIFMFIYGRKLIEGKLLLMFSGLIYDEHDIEPKIKAEMEIQEFQDSLVKEEIEINNL